MKSDNVSPEVGTAQSRSLAHLRTELRNHLQELTYQKVGDIYDVTKALIWKIVNTNYEPRSLSIRKRLRLPTATPRMCSTCGDDFFPNVPWRVKCFKCRKPRISPIAK